MQASLNPVLPTDLVDADKAAEILQVSRGTVYHWLRRGYLTHYRVGRLVRIRKADLANWLERERRDGVATTEPQLT